MTTRLAPWQRNMIALARGILLEPSGQMKWMANIFVENIQRGQMYSLFPIKADNPYDAARSAAEQAARAYYQDMKASTGFINKLNEPDMFNVSVGIRRGPHLINSKTFKIWVREYRGVQ